MTTIPLKKLLSQELQEPATPASFLTRVSTDDWLKENEEGQLAVDVYQTKDTIIIQAPIAGVRPEDLDISIQNDMVTIRGRRERSMAIADDDYFYRECHWGSFSRSIILPTDVKTENVEAELKHGILTVTLPKAKTSRLITVRGEENDA